MGKVINYENRLNKLQGVVAGGYIASKHMKQYMKLVSWQLQDMQRRQFTQMVDDLPLIQKLFKKK